MQDDDSPCGHRSVSLYTSTRTEIRCNRADRIIVINCMCEECGCRWSGDFSGGIPVNRRMATSLSIGISSNRLNTNLKV